MPLPDTERNQTSRGTQVSGTNTFMLTDLEIAARFDRIADVLEIQGELSFKIKAYRRAADTIRELEDTLSDLDARDALKEIPGFGEAIIAKTRDFLTRGTTPLYERIKDAVPSGVVTMAGVPGIGPKSAKALWNALGVTNLDELEIAARENRVQTVAGFGAAKEKGILEAIARGRRLLSQMPAYVAEKHAERLASRLRSRDEVGFVEVGGGLRRGAATVREITFAVVTSDEAATRAALEELHANDPSLSESQIPVRFVTETDAGGAGLLRVRASGDDAFLEALAPRLAERGSADWNAVAGADEETVFRNLGLPFIAPELREGEEFVKLARANTLPKLVELADFKGQLHEHSKWSDGRATIREMAHAAIERGYEYLAITDHSKSLVVANGLNRDRILAQLDEIRALNTELAGKITLLCGLEADILQDGSLDCDDDVLAQLDIVVGSVHIRYKETAEQMTARIVRALENPHLDILGHPTGRLLGRREPFAVDIETVIETAARLGKVLEINAAPDRLDLSDEHARYAKSIGGKLTVNADAHSTAGLDWVTWGLKMARRAGLEADDVINTYYLARLREFLKR